MESINLHPPLRTTMKTTKKWDNSNYVFLSISTSKIWWWCCWMWIEMKWSNEPNIFDLFCHYSKSHIIWGREKRFFIHKSSIFLWWKFTESKWSEILHLSYIDGLKVCSLRTVGNCHKKSLEGGLLKDIKKSFFLLSILCTCFLFHSGRVGPYQTS